MKRTTHLSAVVFAIASLSLSTGGAPKLLFAAPVLPPALVARVEAPDPKIPFEKYQLSNGMEVILAPNRSVPVVAVNVWYHVGSSHETYGKSGFAHLFEHMLFQGSKNVGSDKHFETLKKIGVSDVNGTTNPDRTNYYEVVPSNQLATALWLESDRMGHLLPLLTEESFRNQVEVVRNERRQNYDNRPYGKARFEVAKAMYPEGHPYRYLTIGRHEDLANASLEDVKNFYRTWYVPSNATLCISGDFDVDATKKLIEKWFGGFPASAKPTVVTVPAPMQKAGDVTVNDEFAKSRQIQFVWHSPANFAPQDAELDLAASALGDEGTGRLYKTLVIEKGLAQGVAAFQGGATFSGTFSIVVTLSKDADLAEVKRLVLAEVQNMSKTPVTQREYQRTVTGIEAAAVYRLESAFGRSEVLQSYNHFVGDPSRISWDLDRYRKSNAENVRAAVARYLPTDKAVTVTTMPAVAAPGAKK